MNKSIYYKLSALLFFLAIISSSFAQDDIFLNDGIESLKISNEIKQFDTTTWKLGKLPGSALQIKFPISLSFEEKQIYNSKGLQKIQSLAYGDPNFNLLYQVTVFQVAYGLKMKDVKPIFDEEVQRYAINFGGYPVIEKTVSGDNYEALNFEIFTKPNKYLRGKLIYSNGYISSFIVSGNPPQIFSLPANYFLNGVTGYNESTAQKINVPAKKIKSSKKKPTSVTNTPEWVKFSTKEFDAEFPIKPIEKIFKIQNFNGEDYYSKNYFAKLNAKKISFVGSVSSTFNDRISPESIFANAIQAVLKEVNGKIVMENPLPFMKYPSKEFIISSNKNMYKVRYFVTPNGFYQSMVKGTVKSIESSEANRFINNFKIN